MSEVVVVDVVKVLDVVDVKVVDVVVVEVVLVVDVVVVVGAAPHAVVHPVVPTSFQFNVLLQVLSSPCELGSEDELSISETLLLQIVLS